MKSLWTALCLVAIANLLGLAGAIGWLVSGDRVNADRLRQVRQIFSTTVAEDQFKAQAAEAAAAAEAQQQASQSKIGTPPLSGADVLTVRLQQADADRQRAESASREAAALRAALQQERKLLDEERAVLARQRKEFEDTTRKLREAQSGEQFQRVLATYESLRADAAHKMLQELIAQGQQIQVVEYLHAMQERTRGRIMGEFVKQDPKLAAGLLEQLRVRGSTPASDGAAERASPSP